VRNKEQQKINHIKEFYNSCTAASSTERKHCQKSPK